MHVCVLQSIFHTWKNIESDVGQCGCRKFAFETKKEIKDRLFQ